MSVMQPTRGLHGSYGVFELSCLSVSGINIIVVARPVPMVAT